MTVNPPHRQGHESCWLWSRATGKKSPRWNGGLHPVLRTNSKSRGPAGFTDMGHSTRTGMPRGWLLPDRDAGASTIGQGAIGSVKRTFPIRRGVRGQSASRNSASHIGTKQRLVRQRGSPRRVSLDISAPASVSGSWARGPWPMAHGLWAHMIHGTRADATTKLRTRLKAGGSNNKRHAAGPSQSGAALRTPETIRPEAEVCMAPPPLRRCPTPEGETEGR